MNRGCSPAETPLLIAFFYKKDILKKDFQGIWIDKKIWLLKELTMVEKLFLSEINNLDNEHGCYASNNYFADIFQLTPGRCSQVINSLKKKGLISIKMIKKGGMIEKRVLRILNTGIKNTKGGIYYSKEGIKNTKGGYLENAKGIHISSRHINRHINKDCDSCESPETKDIAIPENQENWKYIESLFRERQEYDNWGKQRKHCKDLDNRIHITYKARAPDISLKKFTKGLIDFFWFLVNSNKPFWQKQKNCFFPATLNSERIWNMFYAEILNRKKPDEKEMMKGLENL